MDTVRVSQWDEFIGQEKLKHRLDTHIRASLQEGHVLDHILLVAPPGFGKTALAGIIANRLNKPMNSATLPIRERALIRLVELSRGLIFLDEIHRASNKEQENYLTLLESGFYSGRNGQRYRPFVTPFTVIAATTEPNKIIPALYDRFPVKPDFDEYTDKNMRDIILGMAGKTGVSMAKEVAWDLGKATCGTPRVAKQFVHAYRDLLAISGINPTAQEVLQFCRITPKGLSKQHVDYLRIIKKNYGPTGLKTLQTHLGLSEAMIRDLERVLLRNDYITYTDRGRELSPEGRSMMHEMNL